MTKFLIIFPWDKKDPTWKKGMIGEFNGTIPDEDQDQNYVFP